jgi:type I restriction enzyme M protein
MLKPGGRAAVVIKNTFLSNTDNAAVKLRKELLENCSLHTILDCPGGTFIGAGVKTVVLFFTKGEPTLNTWFYELNVGRNMGKTNPLNDNDLKEFVELQKTAVSDKAKGETVKSWSLAISDIDQTTYDLSVKNPNIGEAEALRAPKTIIEDIIALDKESEAILAKIQGLL